MKKIFFFTLILITIPKLSFSQDGNIGGWYMYFGQLKFKQKFNLHNEVQYRNYNIIGDLEQLLLRTGIGFNLTENNNNILLGYGYILSENYSITGEKVQVQENRIFQQFITKQHFNRVKIQHRYRFEERFIEDEFKFRFRYFLAINVSLNNKEFIDNTLYLSAYNEIFINGSGDNFDRDRLYGALGYKFNSKVKVELGYMNQFFQNGERDQIMAAVFANF